MSGKKTGKSSNSGNKNKSPVDDQEALENTLDSTPSKDGVAVSQKTNQKANQKTNKGAADKKGDNRPLKASETPSLTDKADAPKTDASEQPASLSAEPKDKHPSDSQPSDNNSSDKKSMSSQSSASQSTDTTKKTSSASASRVSANSASVASSSAGSRHTAQTTSTPTSKKSKFMLPIVGFLLLMVLVGAAVLAYWAWQNNQAGQGQLSDRLARINELEATLDQRIVEQSNQIESLKVQLKQYANGDDELALELSKLSSQQDWVKQRLENHTNRIRALAGTSREDWLLAEARYLLRLANQRMLTERSTQSATAIMKSVDAILNNLDDADLFTVRKAIQSDIAALTLSPPVDREGIYLRIGAIAEQLATLQFKPFGAASAEQESIDAAKPDVSQMSFTERVKYSAKKATEALSHGIEVRHYDQKPVLFVSEEQEAAIRYQLTMLLGQAQSALLREESKIYQASLKNAVEIVDQHFDQFDKKDALLSSLNTLKDETIKQPMPDISSSLDLLTDYIERYHALTPEQNRAIDESDSEDAPAANDEDEA